MPEVGFYHGLGDDAVAPNGGIASVLAVFEMVPECVADRIGVTGGDPAGDLTGLAVEKVVCSRLRLFEGEDRNAVGVADVIRRTKGLVIALSLCQAAAKQGLRSRKVVDRI